MYNQHEISFEIGAFEQAMLTQIDIPGTSGRLSPGAIVGILAAAMRSGLPASRMVEVIDRHFEHCASPMKRMLKKYEGNDWTIDLWFKQANNRYKLCTDLCRPEQVGWRYDMAIAAEMREATGPSA